MLQYTILDLVKRPFVIYKDVFQNKYCVEPRRGKTNKRTMIISLQNSGINVMHEIMSTIDMYHVRINYDKTTLGDYRFLTSEDMVRFSRKYDNYTFNFSDSYKWITDGQYINSNLKYDDDVYITLRDSDYLVYLFKRDIRTCLISHALDKLNVNKYFDNGNKSGLMECYITRTYYREILELTKMMLPWFTSDTFDVIKYEDIFGTKNNFVQKLIEDFNIRENYREDIENCIGTQISDEKNVINWRDYWNSSIERWYVDNNFNEINKNLGYE